MVVIPKGSLFDSIHAKLQGGRLAEALRQLLDGRGVHLRSPYNENRNHAWYLVGDIYFRRREYRLAARAFRLAWRCRSEDWQALMALGNCFDLLGEPRNAERYFRRALLIRPRCRKLQFNLGNSLMDQRRYDEAAKLFSRISADRRSGLMRRAGRNLRLCRRAIRAPGK